MELAGLLLEKGVDSSMIIDETFYKKTYKQNLLMARTVLESVTYMDGKVIVGYISKETMKDFKANVLDTEGIVEQLRLTDGVEIAVFAYQMTKKTFKFSLRAKNYADVNIIATKFGGGGHVKASGFEATGVYEELLAELLEEIKLQIR